MTGNDIHIRECIQRILKSPIALVTLILLSKSEDIY